MSSETISGGVPMPANHAAAIIPPAIPDLFSVYLVVRYPTTVRKFVIFCSGIVLHLVK
jgi:hypothetical protein